MIYLLRTSSNTPPHYSLFINDFREDNKFYYHTGEITGAYVWSSFDEAQAFADKNSRGGPDDQGYAKHKVMSIEDKTWFEYKLKGRTGFSSTEWMEENEDLAEDCGCSVCARRIATHGTYADQIAQHEQWKKDNPEESAAMSEYLEEQINSIMSGEQNATS